MTIVVVDDSMTNLVVLKSLSSKVVDQECKPFLDSRQALQWLLANQASIVVVDYSMPGLNGLDFITSVRASPLHETTPIVMVTSSSDVSVRVQALRAGASDFLNKPVEAIAFKACLAKHLVRNYEHTKREIA